jgi:hypothetical protein
MDEIKHDAVNHPSHYTSHPSGIECIQVTEHYDFVTGNILKYAWRAGLKHDKLEDLLKCQWYVNRAIENERKRLEKEKVKKA